MKLEEELQKVRPALDRAMGAAAATVERRPEVPAPRGLWARPKPAVLAFAVAVCIAAVVGIVARLDSSARHGDEIAPRDTTGVTLPNASTSTAPATTTSTGTPSTSAAPTDVQLQSVEWNSVEYPIAPFCGHVFDPPVTVGSVEYAAPAPGVQLAIVEVACTHGAGTPPVAVYVYGRASSISTPHLMGTLVAVSDGWQASAFTLDGATVSLPVRGFSSASLPNCCPDVQATLVWRWTGARYELVSSVPPHVPGPAAYGGY